MLELPLEELVANPLKTHLEKKEQNGQILCSRRNR